MWPHLFQRQEEKGVFSGITVLHKSDIQDDELRTRLRMDSEVPRYRYTAHYNIHVDRADNECFTSAQAPLWWVGERQLLISEGQHHHELVW